MQFEEIQLPADYIASMYKDTLVVIDHPNRNKQPENANELMNSREKSEANTTSNKKQMESTCLVEKEKAFFLGENKKKITILVLDETATFIKEEWLQFLSNILLACKLNLDDVAIINQYTHAHLFKTLQEALQPEYCIVFLTDWKSLDLPFVIPTYQIQSYNQCKFLPAKPLHTYLPDNNITKEEKRKLWLSLKNLFNIN
ncbi:hypothetical protein [Hydrotalea sp.]|uniref:hypothetical protein n=1 Tax=Hydrotalea sp. TaxID=2881279 RepID=UPI002604E29D|nr:hypothetical protein [Hydrotalea sp.]